MPRVRVLGGEVDGRDLKDAIMVTYKGHISKFYCKDNKSTQFNYSPGEFYPEFIEEEYWTGGFLIGQTFGFLLKNDEDYVKYYLEFEAIFDEFTSYKMTTVGKVKYPDIFMSIDDMKQFFYVDITNDLIWQ
jgi:hypothetical protein